MSDIYMGELILSRILCGLLAREVGELISPRALFCQPTRDELRSLTTFGSLCDRDKRSKRVIDGLRIWKYLG
jgi:hypothetical protein